MGVVMNVSRFLLGVAALATFLPAQAQGTVWKCIGEDGRPQYTNVQRDTAGRNCTVVNREVSVVPAPKSAEQRAAPRASSSFPKVDAETQRSRDDARRRILEEELAAEQAQLEQAQAALAEQESIRLGNERNYQKVLDRLQPYKDAVERHQKNIEALQKEIANLR